MRKSGLGDMQDVVVDAVHRHSRDEWWASVHSALDDLGAAETASYQAESSRLDAAAADGLALRRDRSSAHRITLQQVI